MPVIKIGGKKNSAAKKTAAKPAARSAKKSTSNGSTRSTARKTTATKTKATPKKAKAAAPRGPRTPKTDPKLLARHQKALEAAGTKRAKTEEAHKEAVDAVNEAAQAALADEVPMTLIADTLGVSRQWLYKMGSFRGRGNGAAKSNGRATSAAKKTAARKPAAKKPAAKKTTGTKRTIRRGR